MKKIFTTALIMLTMTSFAQESKEEQSKRKSVLVTYKYTKENDLTGLEYDQDNVDGTTEKVTCEVVRVDLDTAWTSGAHDGQYTVKCSNGTCWIVDVGWFGLSYTPVQTVMSACN